MAASEGVPGPSHLGYSDGGDGDIVEYSDERFLIAIEDLWELKIKPKEFPKMKPDMVQQIYLWFLRDVGSNLEKMNQLQLDSLDTVCPSDEYAGTLQLLTLYQSMQKYMKLIFNEDSFRFSDVFNPRPKRTRKFFAMIYSYIMSSESCLEAIGQIDEEIKNRIEHRDKTNSAIHELKQTIAERKTENTMNEVEIEEEKLRIDEKTKLLQESQERKIELKRLVDEVNMSLATLNTHTKEKELRIIELKEEKEKMEGQVIHPDEKEEINKMKEAVSTLNTDNLATMEHTRKLQEKVKGIVTHREKTDKCFTMLQEIELEKSKLRDLEATLEEKLSQISEVQEDVKKQEEHNLQFSQHGTSSDNGINNMRHVWELKRKSMDNEIKERKHSLEEATRSKNEHDIAYKDIQDTIAALDEEIKGLKESINTSNTLISSNYTVMLNMIEEENMDLSKLLQEAGEKLQDLEKLVD